LIEAPQPQDGAFGLASGGWIAATATRQGAIGRRVCRLRGGSIAGRWLSSRSEVAMAVRFMKPGNFDALGSPTVQRRRFTSNKTRIGAARQ